MFHYEREPVSPLRRRFIDDLRVRNKSPRTIETYVLRVVQFSRQCGRSPAQVGPAELRAYLRHLVARQVSWSMFNQSVCALRFLYNVTLSRPHLIKHLPFPKRPRQLPVVLSPEEVVRLLDAALAGRDRALLDVAYSCGLRLKELLGLAVRDIDSARMVLHIRAGKGQKERFVPLSPRLLDVLRGYWKEYRPATWLFPGVKPALALTGGAVQRICKRTAKRAGLAKHVHPHTLRHSFATHLLEAGVDLLSVQALLGHSHFNTTAKYLHISMRRLQQLPQLLEGLALTPTVRVRLPGAALQNPAADAARLAFAARLAIAAPKLLAQTPSHALQYTSKRNRERFKTHSRCLWGPRFSPTQGYLSAPPARRGESGKSLAAEQTDSLLYVRPRRELAMATRSSAGPQPDQPAPFGYKAAWLALSTPDTQGVATALRLRQLRAATWAEGVAAAYQSSVFVTPPLGAWTLAVGFSLFPPDGVEAFVKPLVEELSRRFGDAQYFCTHRVVELHVWARALKGRLVRGYGWIGEKGLTLWDEGAQTGEERDLGFRFFDERSPEIKQGDYWARKDLTFPDEGCVMRLAGHWSVDPTTLGEQFKEPGLGLLGSLT